MIAIIKESKSAPSNNYQCLLTQINKFGQCIFLIYVDDALVIGDNMKTKYAKDSIIKDYT